MIRKALFTVSLPWIFVGVGLIVLGFGIFLTGSVAHNTYFVSPTGNDSLDGRSQSTAFATIDHALQFAQPGDHVQLADGNYYQSFKSVRSGRPGLPITIIGSQQAVLYGSSKDSRVVEINHSFITLDGFRIDGHNGSGLSHKDFRDKLIYVIGAAPKQGVIGLVITRMLIENAGGECVRLRYFATDNEISYSTIRNCGIFDFKFHEGTKNGEGIYMGTAPEQRNDGKNPTNDVDNSTRNHIHHNTIETNGNECVDIKEGSTDNLVEFNSCSHQQDPKSGGLDARGNHNILRYNTIFDNVGTGIRLGGDGDQDGIDNVIYGNTITGNMHGAMRILRLPQGQICGNKVNNNGPGGTNNSITDAMSATCG